MSDNNYTLRPCPNCGYRRKTSDTSPDWQCPRCGVAYHKVRAGENSTHNSTPNYTTTNIPSTSKRLLSHPILFIVGRCIEILFLCLLVGLIIAYNHKGQLPPVLTIDFRLTQTPIQMTQQTPPFSFMYRKQKIDIRPQAEYQLWGLVVSHNDIHGFIDGYDPDDVNLKDVCVIWGNNMLNDAYLGVTFWNRQWTCNFEYPRELMGKFSDRDLSNNHLLSASPAVRDKIRDIKVGDQIYLRGKLVDYHTPTGYGWRTSSLTREDTGNGACEVLLVDEIQFLQRGTPGWYAAYAVLKWLLIGLIVLRLLLQLIDVKLTRLPEFKRYTRSV